MGAGLWGGFDISQSASNTYYLSLNWCNPTRCSVLGEDPPSVYRDGLPSLRMSGLQSRDPPHYRSALYDSGALLDPSMCEGSLLRRRYDGIRCRPASKDRACASTKQFVHPLQHFGRAW